jgi:Sec-independent protein translocase protein TatA
MGKSFVELKSSMDDIREEKDAAIKKAAKEIARNMSASVAKDSAKGSADIDKLLQGFSDGDKYLIMKFAFIFMC